MRKLEHITDIILRKKKSLHLNALLFFIKALNLSMSEYQLRVQESSLTAGELQRIELSSKDTFVGVIAAFHTYLNKTVQTWDQNFVPA